MNNHFEDKKHTAAEKHGQTNYQSVGTTIRERTMGTNSFKGGYELGHDHLKEELDNLKDDVNKQSLELATALEDQKKKYEEVIELLKKNYEEVLNECKVFITPAPCPWGYSIDMKTELLNNIDKLL